MQVFGFSVFMMIWIDVQVIDYINININIILLLLLLLLTTALMLVQLGCDCFCAQFWVFVPNRKYNIVS